MIRALLDCPGSLVEILAQSRGSQVLLDFGNLLKNEGLDPVPFLTPEEHSAWRLTGFPGLGAARGAIERLLRGIVRWEGGNCEANPISGPRDLSHVWKCSLRDAMYVTDDWRSPQIVSPAFRRNQWPNGPEVEIWIRAREGTESLGPHHRIIVELESYPEHPHARADLDPWDLRHIHPPRQTNSDQSPCILPKPPELRTLRLSDISERPNNIPWKVGGKCYFIPSSTWSPWSISKDRWRRGRAFPYGDKNGRSGWIDGIGRVWHWDLDHECGHWDVQLDGGEYLRVSYLGEVLS